VAPPEVSPADYANALERLHAGMRKLDVRTPHFTDRVAAAQQLVENSNLTPELAGAEIGHTSDFSTPAGQFCLPGQSGCDSYDTAHWLGFSPLQIKSVTFANGSTANKWAVVSDFGGTAEVGQYCPSYGGPYCTYP
jgi:hypothetical protein